VMEGTNGVPGSTGSFNLEGATKVSSCARSSTTRWLAWSSPHVPHGRLEPVRYAGVDFVVVARLDARDPGAAQLIVD
jgi:hypothetical protein